MSSSTDFVVSEIKVSGSFKNWSDPRNNTHGISGGSEFEITAIPVGQDPWTPQEAQVVAFDLRMQIHVILMADAQLRGVPLPADAQTTLIQYREKVKERKSNLGDCPAWKDADVPPPNHNSEPVFSEQKITQET